MKYLSMDLEATGLGEEDLIIEFGLIPFDTHTRTLEYSLSFHLYLKCPAFEILKPRLDNWVIEHNEGLIRKASTNGITLGEFKGKLEQYLNQDKLKSYFFREPKGDSSPEKIVLFGKSVNATDLPFLNRDLGWDFMRKYFSHQVLDLTSVTLGLIDQGLLGPECSSGGELMKSLGFGNVAHTALEDAKNTALMYLKILEKFTAH